MGGRRSASAGRSLELCVREKWVCQPRLSYSSLELFPRERTMIRTHVFATFVAGGVCFALLGQWNLVDDQPGWDPREARSEMLDQKASLHVRRATHTDTSATVSRWEPPKFVRAVTRVADAHLRPNGARISLTSFRSLSSTLYTCDDGPDVTPPFVSVNTNPPVTYSTCSSKAGGAATECSVKQIAGGSCSAQGGANSQYCSTGTNGGGGSNNSCSVVLASNSQCSAQIGSGESCSTQSDQMNGSGTCSVGGKANPVQTGSSCSTGNLSGAPSSSSTNDTCSAIQSTANAVAPGTTCSIVNIGASGGNQRATCSVDGATSSSCSVNSQSNNDFCSVDNTNTFGHGGTCTVIKPVAGSTASCSIIAGSAAGHCSIANSNGTFTGPVNGQCVLIP